MASVTIRLNSIGEVKEFNRIAATVPGDVDLHSGRYCVDAKSIMGIFALNLARELTVDSPTLSEEELHKNPSQAIIPTHQKSRMFPRPNHPLAK